MKIIRAVGDIFSNSQILDNGLQMWRFFPSRRLNNFHHGYNVFRDMCKAYIDEAVIEIKKKQATDGQEEGDPSMLELFFSRGVDENTAVVMALDMMFAGVDTSSHTSGFLMYQLAKHPNVQERLFQEVKAELPVKWLPGNFNARFCRGDKFRPRVQPPSNLFLPGIFPGSKFSPTSSSSSSSFGSIGYACIMRRQSPPINSPARRSRSLKKK